MPVPWLQIVQLVPSIVDVSRELLRKAKRMPPPAEAIAPENIDELASRVVTLEENERRQAELVSQMAEQMAGMARAVTALHRLIWLGAALGVALVVAIVAVAYLAAA